MTADIEEMIAELERLDAGATEAPWGIGDGITKAHGVRTHLPVDYEQICDMSREYDQGAINANLIAAARNAMPVLLKLARLAIEARGIVYTDADEFINWSRRFDTTLANLKAGKGASDAC